jgi:DUF971 family protein
MTNVSTISRLHDGFVALGRADLIYHLTTMSDTTTPVEIKLHQKSRMLEIAFADGARFSLPYEFLRVHSPSAEVRGHGPGQEVLQTGKRHVGIVSVEPVGSYALQPTFTDGHATGIFAWDYLRHLGEDQSALWTAYLEKLAASGASRDAEQGLTSLIPPANKGGCV